MLKLSTHAHATLLQPCLPHMRPQLLRCVPDIGTIYFLCRDKRGLSAETRLRRLLHSGLFHAIRDRPDLRSKVVLVKGDLLAAGPSLGIPATAPETRGNGAAGNASLPVESGNGQSQGTKKETNGHSHHGSADAGACATVDLEHGALGGDVGAWDVAGKNVPAAATVERLAAEPHLLIIHSAARITLEDPIQVTLRHNYLGTRALLQLASQLPGLAGFLHVSTAFVNCCKPFLPEGTAQEQLYPLRFGDREVGGICFL